MRDMRDYRMGSAGSPFNIAAKSLRLGDFAREQTMALLGQHTEETGQAFAPEALEAVWTQTRGQPWLVNALAYGACFENKTVREDRSRTVTADHIAAVREDLIVNRVTHLDYLADKLREDRVRRVIEPMLSGTDRHAFTDRDVAYARDLRGWWPAMRRCGWPTRSTPKCCRASSRGWRRRRWICRRRGT